ncbi:MAG: methyltransferase [Thermodesulfobacteriota bacterium]
MKKWQELTVGSAIIFYLLIALEVVVMLTPFSAYFYSVYAPVLNRLEASPWTSWLTAFFLPHITYSGDFLLGLLAFLGPVLLTIGMLIFFVCAYQVYWAKLFKQGVVSGGLYSQIRHPQYLGLAIAGLGLLLYWPRFFILISYLTLLFVYYLLARNEEWRMMRQYGDGYRNYLQKIPMFLPGNPGGKLFARLTGGTQRKGPALAILYVAVLGASLALAFGLRGYSLSQLPVVFSQNLVAVSMTPSGKQDVRRLVNLALGSEKLAPLLAKLPTNPDRTLVAYVMPQDYMMTHLLADLGEHEAHHGKKEESGLWAAIKHLAQMYALKPMRQLRQGATSPAKRIIFAEARTPTGEDVAPQQALGVRTLRHPLFFVDVDAAQGEVILTMETPRRHAWGTIPVPAF